MVVASITDAWEKLTLSSFSLQDVDGFPYTVYEEQLAKYEEAERWFTGQALNDQPESPGDQVDIYPMRINPIIGTVLKHAYILFGEPQDDGRPLVVPKLVYVDDNEKEVAEKAEERLNFLWWENNGRSLMMENGICSQIYGGSIFKATYSPWELDRGIPIRIERINPKNFIGIPDSSDQYRLSESWIVRKIHRNEARRWGYKGDDEIVWKVEHWKPDTYQILIDGKVAVFADKAGEEHRLEGENRFGFVQQVYIPHIRTGDFYGMNAFDHLKGLVRELNLRFGDFGDAVNDDAHSYVAYRNVQGTPSVKSIAEGLPAIDLGSTSNISGNEPDPDMFEIRKQRASQSMESLVQDIYNQYRRDSFVPAVAEGEDEGSQRSGLTLAIRFWPLTSHVSQERIFWSTGLDLFNHNLLKMMAEIGTDGITKASTQLRIKHKWAPLLPRDREVDVQEWVQRASANLGAIDTLLELTGDIENVEEEKEKILDWITEVKKIEQEFAVQQQGFGNNGSQSSQASSAPGASQ